MSGTMHISGFYGRADKGGVYKLISKLRRQEYMLQNLCGASTTVTCVYA